MNVRFDLVGEMSVLCWQRQRDLQRQFERERLIVILDGAKSDGSLKAVRGTHGVSPYWYYGGPSCVLFYQSGGQDRYHQAESGQKILCLSCAAFLSSRTNWRAPGKIFRHDRPWPSTGIPQASGTRWCNPTTDRQMAERWGARRGGINNPR